MSAASGVFATWIRLKYLQTGKGICLFATKITSIPRLLAAEITISFTTLGHASASIHIFITEYTSPISTLNITSPLDTQRLDL